MPLIPTITPAGRVGPLVRAPERVRGWYSVDVDDARTIGLRLRRVRDSRGKPLRVVAELAGMSTSTLHRIEHGRRAVTLPELVALANALDIAPSELTTLPVPAPANGHTGSTIEAIRLALDAIETGRPGCRRGAGRALRDGRRDRLVGIRARAG